MLVFVRNGRGLAKGIIRIIKSGMRNPDSGVNDQAGK
jgi:hypothetical protein